MKCLHCSAETPAGRHLCRKHLHTLEVAIANAMAYYGDLETIRSRQTRYAIRSGGGSGAKGKTMPIGMDLRFDVVVREGDRVVSGHGTLLEQDLSATLRQWSGFARYAWPPLVEIGPTCRHCDHDSCAERRARRAPARSIRSHAAHLTRLIPRIPTRDWAGDILADMLTIERRLRAFVDRPPELIYAGTCMVCAIVGDHSPLYAREGDDKIECPAEDCDRVYDVSECREALLGTVDESLCTAAQIASLAVYFGVLDDRDKVRNRINQWHKRGVIAPSQLSPEGEPMYVFGHIVSRILDADSARQERTVKRVVRRSTYDVHATPGKSA